MSRYVPYVIAGMVALSVWLSLAPYTSKQTARLVLVTSSPCVPCEQLKQAWPDWAPKYEETQDAQRYDVIGTPTLIAFDRDGKELKRHQGYNGRAHLEQWLRDLP